MAEAIVPPPSVNGPRLWASLERMAQIGATPKGGDAEGNLRNPAFTILKIVSGQWKVEQLMGGDKPI